MKILWIFLILFPFVFLNCEGLFESECSKCQSAIDHMSEKIIQQNCNPYTMENAWNGIKEDCGNLADTYVGIMAETCSNGPVDVPLCNDENILVDMGLHNINFQFFTSTGVPDSLAVIVLFQVTGGTSFDFGFKGNDSVGKQFDTHIYEGEDVEIIVQNALSNVELARDTQMFTFDRQGYWSSDRGIDIRYNNATGSYSIAFFSW